MGVSQQAQDLLFGATPELRRMYLKQRQSLPLNIKVALTKRRITEWYEAHDGMVYVAFSGGKDSTVLLHIVRSMYPEVPAVFADTGLEFPEIRDFVRQTANVVWVKPRKNFKQVLEEEGYPIISKSVARRLRDLKNPTDKNASSRALYLTGVKRDGTHGAQVSRLAQKWHRLIDAPFKVSEKCCDYMKKYPSIDYEKESRRVPFVGTMADDSQQRETEYIRSGCNSFSGRHKSAPIAFWTEADVWDYIKVNEVPYCEIYDKGERRTGCIFCMFGIAQDKGRFERLKELHPQLHTYCMENLGLKDVLEYLRVPTGCGDAE